MQTFTETIQYNLDKDFFSATSISEYFKQVIQYFIHNTRVTIIIQLVAYIPFIFFSHFIMMYDIFLLTSFMIAVNKYIGGFGVLEVISHIWIHSIAEILACNIAFAIAFTISKRQSKKNLGFKNFTELENSLTFIKILNINIKFIFPLMLIAALIEAL